MQPKNLIDILQQVNDSDLSDYTGITFINGNGEDDFFSYRELYCAARSALAFLQNRGIEPRHQLVFQIEDNKTFIIIFWACILGGVIPVPLSIGQTDGHKQKLFNVWPVLESPWLIIAQKDLPRLQAFAASNRLEKIYEDMLARSVDESGIFISSGETGEGQLFQAGEHDIAFIQFSSGSTGAPKGVILTHQNLLVNMQAISQAASYTEMDSTISWMPLVHDMGLIGFHLNPLFSHMNQYLIPVALFIRRPTLWLEKVSEYKISVLCSPNFGYQYTLRHGHFPVNPGDWDLSGVRLIYNGAEPISEKLCREFTANLARYGLKSNSMCPVYGLAEASLAVSISGMDEEPIAVELDRRQLKIGDEIKESDAEDNAVSFLNVGWAVNGCSIMIMNVDGRVAPDLTIGYIHIKGANVTSGYYNNDSETKKTINNEGWLNTGDTGFLKAGALYVTGRAKDIIFANGQNYYPHDIERVAEEVEGIELNKIAVAGFFNPDSQQEETLAFVLFRGQPDAFPLLASRLSNHITYRTGLTLDRVIPVKDIPKTTSGKLQRFRLVEQFRNAMAGYGDAQTDPQSGGALTDPLFSTGQITDKPFRDTPENEYEQKLLDIWQRILKRTGIGVKESFFEIGGNSLKAAEMSMQLFKELQVDLSLAIIAENQTIRALAIIVKECIDSRIKDNPTLQYTPITIQPERVTYPVSSAQKRLIYLWEADKLSVAYNIPVAFKLEGAFDRDRLEHAIGRMIKRHPSLRSFFHLAAGPHLRIHDECPFTLDMIECSGDDLKKILKRLVQPFDLTKYPLFRISLLQLENGEQILFADFHHIIADGISVYLFMEELLASYCGRELPALPVRYTDFVFWEQEYLRSAPVKHQEEYWLTQLQGELPLLELPLDFPRPVLFSMEGGKLEFEFDRETTAGIRRLARQQQSTTHSLLFACYFLLLSKYTGQEDLIIGIPVAGRRHPDLWNIAGMFVNNLAIRTILDGEETFIELAHKVNSIIDNALHHQDYAFGDLIQSLQDRRDVSRNAIFDTMFVYQNMGIPEMRNDGYSMSRYYFDPGISKYDISLEVFEFETVLKYSFEYASTLLKESKIRGMASHFSNLVKRVLEYPETALRDLSVLSEAEYAAYIDAFNATGKEFPDNKTIHLLIEEQVARTPGRIAIEFEQTTISYQELNNRADRLAASLRAKGIGPDTVVGISLPRSPSLVIGILAILKTGACYLPIDTDLPSDRVQYLIRNSGCQIVLTAHAWLSAPVFENLQDAVLLAIDGHEPAIAFADHAIDMLDPVIPSPAAGKRTATPDDLAYIIYTSGTTGLPKGVMIRHRSLVNYIYWAAEEYVGKEKCSFPLFTSISFDLTVTSLFVPLITGNSILIYQDDPRGGLIERIMAENKADIIKLTPSHLKLMNEYDLPRITGDRKLKKFIVGGERLETRLARSIAGKFGGDIEIFNEYGPTEATVGCMIYKFRDESEYESVPIGIPASNTRIYLLDKYLAPVPAGAKGEIYIGGTGLAKGYFSNAELTRQKFIPDPFREGELIYKTGDIGRRLPDGDIGRRPPGGDIEYIGRFDQQVKLNGYRIELSEIENTLIGQSGIRECLVAVRKNNKGQENLVAYYVSGCVPGPGENGDHDNQFEEAALRNYLAGRLPYYMIPARFISLPAIPLTKNGKVDYTALPDHSISADHSLNGSAAGADPSQNRIIMASIKIWEDILEEKGLTAFSNFFELGGDSIKAARIATGLLEYGITVNVKDILTYHSIGQISQHASLAAHARQYEQGLIRGEKNLTPIESWFLSRRFANPSYYNQSVLLRLNRKVNRALLAETFEILIAHHDGLRMNYDPSRKMLIYNERHENVPFRLEEHFLGEKADPGSRLPDLAACCQGMKDNFYIYHSLLLKAGIIHMDADKEMLFISAHHLVMDGVSWRILLEDFYQVYKALEEGTEIKLPLKTASGKIWADQLKTLAGLDEETAWWNKIENTVFAIPQDRETTDWRIRHAERITGVLDKENTEFLLKKAHRIIQTDPPVLLNTALVMTLKEWTGADRFIVEQENHGRHLETVDAGRTIGWFTSMFPMLLEWKGDTTVELIQAIKDQFSSIPRHGLGYGIRTYLPDPGVEEEQRNDPSALRFNYLGHFGRELNNPLFTLSHQSTGNDTDPENNMTARLEINAMIFDEALRVEMTYNRLAHDPSTMQKLMDLYFNNLEELLNYIRAEENIYLIPSDFDGMDLDDEEMNALFY